MFCGGGVIATINMMRSDEERLRVLRDHLSRGGVGLISRECPLYLSVKPELAEILRDALPSSTSFHPDGEYVLVTIVERF